MEFCCDVCSLQGSFTQIIEHFISHHSYQNLVISRRVFSHVSGKIARQSLDYALILRDIMQQGGEIQIDADNIKVRVGYPKKITRVKKINAETQTEPLSDIYANSDLAADMYKLIPSVCEFLANEESIHSVRLLQYMELMESGRFPTTNICYRVFLDLVQWYSISKPSDMRYSPDVKQFWHLGKVLFHSKFDLYAYSSFWLWKCTRYHHFTSRVRNFDTKIFAPLYFTPSLIKMD